MIEEYKKYREIFESEAREIIERAEEILLVLEKEGRKEELLNELFRNIHTLKGSSATIGEKEIEKIAHALEDKLERIKKDKKAIINVEEILREIDRIKNILEKKEEKEYRVEIFLSPDTPLKGARAFVIIQNIQNKFKIIGTEPELEEIKEGNFEISFKVMVKCREIEELKEIMDSYSEIEHFKIYEKDKLKIREIKEEEIKEIKIKSERIDRIINYMGEILIEKDRFKNLISKIEKKEIAESFENFEQMLSLLQDEIINLRLIPIRSIFGTLPRYVRDEAKKLGKEIEMEIRGEEIEVDRTVLEKLKEPILHLVRNSIDHGIELPEERMKKGKGRRGKILIEVKKEKGTIFITVRDDGRGIDRSRVIRRAKELGILKEGEIEYLGEEKIMEILTHPSFSTKLEADTLSGRGIGLNAVRESLIKLGGDFKIHSEEGKGTEVILRIPVSLAIIRALVVKGGNEKYIIPLSYVQGIYNEKSIKIFSLQGKKFTIIGKKVYPIFEFNKLLGIKENSNENREIIAVEGENKNFVIMCEKIISQQDVFVKNLDEMIMKIPYVTGGTILEDGKPYLIIDPISLTERSEK